MFDYRYLLEYSFRFILAMAVGILIGSERARHGRAAGMRTHILVCVGAALTSMTSLFVSNDLGINGDVFRISAQVISGVGFLGAGMIILKNNNTVTGLTTAAGVWCTGAIGIAIGYGFYIGAVIGTVIFLASIVVLKKFEKQKTNTETVYIEINDMYKTNALLDNIKSEVGIDFEYIIVPPKSNFSGNLGVVVTFTQKVDFDKKILRDLENVVYICDD